MIKSSININIVKLSMLENFSANNGFSISEVVTLLLRKILKDGNFNARKFSAVKYQDVDPDKNWDNLTVYYNEVDYEFFTDMRKFFKESVSLLLAKAIDLFLDTILSESDEILHNYVYSDWDIHKINTPTEVIWSIFWRKNQKPRKTKKKRVKSK